MCFVVPKRGWLNPPPESGGGDLLGGSLLVGGFHMRLVSFVGSNNIWGNLAILEMAKEEACNFFNGITKESQETFFVQLWLLLFFERYRESSRNAEKGQGFCSVQAKIGPPFLLRF
jgi:hypothetical protein